MIFDDFNTRIANNGRVYLCEVYKELGFETNLPEYHDARHAFWDKNGFHENDLDGEKTFTFLDALEEVCETEAQATRIFRCLDRARIINAIELYHDTLDTYSDETLLSIRNFGTNSLIFARRANKLYREKTGL